MSKDDKCVKQCAYLPVKDHINRDTSGFNSVENFCGMWWILLSGDKGGKFMKYHLVIVNSNQARSVDNLHIYCLFEAQDSVENMQKVWCPYHHQIKQMYDKDYTICGKGVIVFLGGDYHFLYDQLGHQGAAPSFPSAFDKVRQSHLQNHAGHPVLSTCPVEKRIIDD